MKIRTSYRPLFMAVLLLVGLTLLSLADLPRLVGAQDNAAKGGMVFKIPDGYMKIPMNKFRGLMMLDPKKPVGMFVTYPDDNETVEALRQRVLVFVAPMFIHAEKDARAPTITWDAKPLPSHLNDGDGKAFVNVYSGEKEEMQVATYERTTGPRPCLYGYFALRHKAAKGDDGRFLDDHGEGVKAFDKLWQSFPK